MSHKLQIRRIVTAERATYVAPSQVPHGESLEDKVFQSIFVSLRDFKPATTIIQTAGQRDVYFDVKEAYNKIMQTYKEEDMVLSFNNKGDEIGKKFISDLFFQLLLIQMIIYQQDPGSYIKRKNTRSELSPS